MWKLYHNPLTSRAGIIKCDVIITANCYAFIRDLHLLNVETNVLGPTNKLYLYELHVCVQNGQSISCELKHSSRNWQIL
jgi:hypothetical protein